MFSIGRQESILVGKDALHIRFIWILLLAGMLIRLILAPVWIGYDTDVHTFMAWADRAATVGLTGLYPDNSGDYFLDYPPGYMYVLYAVGWLHHAWSLDWGSSVSLIVLKMPAMLADLVLALILFRCASANRSFEAKQALGIAALFALNPAVLANSAVWGQVDAFFMLFVLLSFIQMQKNSLTKATVLLAIALLLKPQALLFGPFLLLAWLRKKSLKSFTLSVLCGVAVVWIVTLPFTYAKGLGWLVHLYTGTLASYPYASLNAFNLMALLGGNFVDSSAKIGFISYQHLGLLLLAASLIFSAYLSVKSNGREGSVFYIAFLFLTAVFTVMTKMHERYLYYGLLLALVSFIQLRDRRILFLFLGFSFTHFINVADVLAGSFVQKYHIPRTDGLMLAVSGANVLLFAYACRLGWTLFVPKRRKGIISTPAASISPLPDPEPIPRFFTKKDALLAGALMLVYTAIALYHLGGFKAPQTFWKPSMNGEALVADLGEPYQIARINSFVGAGEGAYSYWFSMNGNEWSAQTTVKSDHTKVFTWNVVEPKTEARYVKVVTDQSGFPLHEIGFFADGGDQILKVQNVTSEHANLPTEGKPENVFDEQGIVPYSPTYMEGTYFDEIYHARTAYEHLHRIEPYESTHPPLGKIFISLGIYLFGMNPFGWRIVGTLFGVAMIPVLYSFAKRLFGRTEYAFIAAFLFTFDFMHFAQTRIATIDVYGVFFIMLMFYFMYRYTTMSFYSYSLRRTLIPLSLSGLLFGIGAASKWIVIYGGAGLALLLFWTLGERLLEYVQAKRRLRADVREVEAAAAAISDDMEAAEVEPVRGVPLGEEEKSRLMRIVCLFPRNAFLTLSWCLVMFVAVPLVIYGLSYIPFMLVPGPGHGLKDVITYQKHIYEYHKNLVATHPFSSAWWEWPMMLRPIWYYQGHFLPDGKLSSIISFGNPLVWWPGFIAVLASFYTAFRRKDKHLAVLLVAFCSQYLPWILVPRLTFIYHYFAMVPFMVLCLTYFLKDLMEDYPDKRKWVYGYLTGVLLLFIVFYPLLSGMVIPKDYSIWLRWLPGWNFF